MLNKVKCPYRKQASGYGTASECKCASALQWPQQGWRAALRPHLSSLMTVDTTPYSARSDRMAKMLEVYTMKGSSVMPNTCGGGELCVEPKHVITQGWFLRPDNAHLSGCAGGKQAPSAWIKCRRARTAPWQAAGCHTKRELKPAPHCPSRTHRRDGVYCEHDVAELHHCQRQQQRRGQPAAVLDREEAAGGAAAARHVTGRILDWTWTRRQGHKVVRLTNATGLQ